MADRRQPMILGCAPWLALLSTAVFVTILPFSLYGDWNCKSERRDLWYYIWVWDMAYNIEAMLTACCALDTVFYNCLISNWNRSMRLKLYIPSFLLGLAFTVLVKLIFLKFGLFHSAWNWIYLKVIVIVGVVGSYLYNIAFIVYYNRNSEQRALLLWKFLRYFWLSCFCLVMYYTSQLCVVFYNNAKPVVVSFKHGHMLVHFFDYGCCSLFCDMIIPLFSMVMHKIVAPLYYLALPVQEERILMMLNVQVSSFKIIFGRNVFEGISSFVLMVIVVLKEELSVVISFGVKYSPEYLARSVNSDSSLWSWFAAVDDLLHFWRIFLKKSGFQRQVTQQQITAEVILHQASRDRKRAKSQASDQHDHTPHADHDEHLSRDEAFNRVTSSFKMISQLHHIKRKTSQVLQMTERLDIHLAMSRAERIEQAQHKERLVDSEERIEEEWKRAVVCFGTEQCTVEAPLEQPDLCSDEGDLISTELVPLKPYISGSGPGIALDSPRTSGESQTSLHLKSIHRSTSAKLKHNLAKSLLDGLEDIIEASATEDQAEEDWTKMPMAQRSQVAFVQRCLTLHWLGVAIPMLSCSITGLTNLLLRSQFPCSTAPFGFSPSTSFRVFLQWSLLLFLNSTTTIGMFILFHNVRLRLPFDAAHVYVKSVINDKWLMGTLFCWCAHISMDELLAEYVAVF